MGKYLSARACMLLISGLIILLSVNAALNKTSSADEVQKSKDEILDKAQKARDTAASIALKAEVAKKGEKVLVEVAGIKGTVILTDGSIHEFNASYIDKPMNEINPGSSLILNYLTKKIGDVSNKDLKMIKKYIAEVRENLTPPKKYVTDDPYSTNIAPPQNARRYYYTKVYDYTAHREVLLMKTGDWMQLNTDRTTGKLNQIINKYITYPFCNFAKPRKGEKILVENSVLDLRPTIDGPRYCGTVILTDGCIYKVEKSDLAIHYDTPIILNQDGILEFDGSYKDSVFRVINDNKDYHTTLTYLKAKIGDVSNKDLNMIKKYAAEVKEKLTIFPRNNPNSNRIMEIVEHTTVYDYKGNRAVLLQRTGNWPQKNNHETAEKLNQIINKYI